MTGQTTRGWNWMEAIGWILLIASIGIGLGLTIWAPV
jgi:hypothetical protein